MKRVRLGLNLDISKDNINQEVASAVAEAGKGIKPIKVELQAASPILKTQSIRLDGASALDQLSKTTIGINADSSRKAASELAGTLSDSIKKSVKDAQGGGLLNLVGSIITAPLRLAGALSANVFRGAGEAIGFGVARELRATLKKELDFDIYQSGIGNIVAELAAAPVNAFVRGNEQLGTVFVKIKNDLQNNLKQAAYSFGDALADSIDADNKLQTFVQRMTKDLSAEKFKNDFKKASEYSAEIAADIRDALASGARLQRLIDPFGEALSKFREQALIDRALPLVLQRAQEISQSGKTTIKAGKYFDKDRGKERDLFVKTGNVVDETTKELIIATGGYAKAQGRSGLRIPGLLTNLPEGTKAIGALNTDTDLRVGPRPTTEERAGALLGSLAKPNVRGYNKDAVEMAAQAIAALQKNPEIKIKFLGESGGGYPAEEAKKILDLLGFADRSEYLAVGTPDFTGRLDPRTDRKILSVDEMLGAEAARLYRPLGLAADTPAQKLPGAQGHPIDHYLQFAELQNFVYGAPLPFKPEELDQAKEAARQFEKISREGRSGKDAGRLVQQAFVTLQTVKRQFDVAKGQVFAELQEVAQSLEGSFVRLSAEPESFSTTREVLGRASAVLAELRDKPQIEAQRIAVIVTKELKQLQNEFLQLEERKDPGSLGAKYKELAAEIEQTIDAFSLDRVIAQARQAQKEAQAQAQQIKTADPNEGLRYWDKAYDVWADNSEVIVESGKQAAKTFKAIKGRQLGLDLGDVGPSPAQQTAKEIMGLVVSMVRTMDVRSVGTLNIKGVAQSAKASEPKDSFIPKQLSFDFDSISAGIAEQVYAVETELVRDKQALEKIFDLVGLGDAFRDATSAANNTVESIQKIERDFLAIVPLGREAKAELQTLLSKLGMVAKHSAVTGAAGAAGGVIGAVQGVENAAFAALPFLKPAKKFVQGVGAPLALTAAATQIPGAGAAIGGAIELAGTAGAGGASAIATAIIDLIGQGVLSHLPPQIVRAILTELPGFLPGLGGQSIAAMAGGASTAVGEAVAGGAGTIAAETITALITGKAIIQAAKGSVELLPEAIKRPTLAAQEFLALPAAQESQQAAARGTQQALEATGRTTKAIAESPQVRARLRPAQEAAAEVVSEARQLPEAAKPIALPAGKTFEAAIDRSKYLEEQFRRLQMELYKVTQAMKADPGNLGLLLNATVQASQLAKQADGAQSELRELREILKSTQVIDGGQSKQLTGYVGAIGQRAAEGRKFLAQLAQQYEASGRDIGRFISAGISAGMDPAAARSAAESIVKILIETTEAGLGIESPSKVFRQIGRFIAQGLGLGVKDGIGDAKKSVEDLTASVTKAAKPQKQAGPGQFFKGIVDGAGQAKSALADLAVKAGLPIGALSKVGGVLKGVGIAALGFVAVSSFGDAIVQAGKAAFDTALQMERLKAQLEFIGGGPDAAAKDLAFLNQIAKDTKQPVLALTDGYTQLKQAVKGTALEGKALEEIYRALAVNARVNGASTEQLKGQQLQLQQVFRKGKADTEDLNTLSENRLALQRKLQEVTKTSGTEFTKLLESGGITADKVAKAIKLIGEDALPGLAKANKTASAAIGEFQRRIEAINNAVGPVLLNIFSATVSAATAGIDLLEDTSNRLAPIFGVIAELGKIVAAVISPIIQGLASINESVKKDLQSGFVVPFLLIRAGLIEIRKSIESTFGILGKILAPLGGILKKNSSDLNLVGLAVNALGAALGFVATVQLVQLAVNAGLATKALVAMAFKNYGVVIPSIVAMTKASVAFLLTPLGATLAAIGIAAAVAAPQVESLARQMSGLSQQDLDKNNRSIEFTKEYEKALQTLSKGIPLTAEELKKLKDNFAQSVKDGKDSAGVVKTLTANLDRLQASALAAAEIQGKLTAAMNASKKAVKEVSKEIDADYTTRETALNESLANQRITRDRFDAEEMDAQQEKTKRYEALYDEQARNLQAALAEAQARLATPMPDSVRGEVVKQVQEIEDQLNDIEKSRGQARIEYLKGIQKQREDIENDRVKRAETEQKTIQTLADAGLKTQGTAEQEMSRIKETELQRRIKLLNEQIDAERNAAGELTDIGENLYSERLTLEAELQKSIADRTGIRSKAEAELVDLEEKTQKSIQSLVQAGVVTELQGEEEISRIKEAQIRRRIGLIDVELAKTADTRTYNLTLASRRELEAELTAVVAEGVNKRYDILLKDVQREQESLAAVLSEVEARSLTDIQRLQTRGAYKQKQADMERLNLTKFRLQQELQAEQNYIAELQKLPDPTDPEKRREAENTLRDAKLKTAQITQQLAEQEYQQQEKIREIAIDAIDERIKGQENLAKAAEEFAGVATRALENQNKLLEAQKSLKQSMASYDDQAYKILIDTEKSETEKAKLQELAAAARLRGLKETQAIERDILELQIEQERVANRVATVKAAAALERAKAEEEKVALNPEATDADKRAASLTTTAADLELGALLQAGQLQDRLAQSRRAQSEIDDRRERLAARFELAQVRTDKSQKEEEIERLRTEASQGIRLNRARRAIDSALPRVDFHSGAIANIQKLGDLNGELKQLRNLTSAGVVGNLLELVNLQRNLSVQLNTLAAQPRVTQNITNNPPTRSRVLVGSKG